MGRSRLPPVVSAALAEEFADARTKVKLPQTNREKQYLYRRRHPEKKIQVDLAAKDYEDLVYVMQAWGFESKRKAIIVALNYLAKLTREGLERIDLTQD